jgi:hypothetical protein
MSEFSPWVTPLNRITTTDTLTGGYIENEDFDCSCDVLSILSARLRKRLHKSYNR